MLLAGLMAALALIGSSRASASYTFVADADGYVQADQPSVNFGSSKTLRVDNSPVTVGYLRFTVSGTSGAVTNVALRVFAASSHGAGYDVYKVLGTPPTFTEAGLMYSNAPALASSKTGSSGATTAGTWTSVDVTSLVSGDGSYEFGLKTTSPTSLALSSREAGANAPQLVVTTSGTVSPPTNTGLPVVSGIARVGQSLTTTNGTWSGSPTSFSYQWRRCSASSPVDPATCPNIGGATAASYPLTSNDLGKFMRVDVTARNGGGPSAPATSAATAAVQAASSDPFIMAAGDIACGATSTGASCQQVATSDLIVNANPAAAAVLPLGDVQYECGETSDFTSFYNPSWGRTPVKSLSHPAVGNHEYIAAGANCPNAPPGAAGYYSYFGAAASPLDTNCTASCKGYYSYNVGSWHLIALNSNCAAVACSVGSAQESWLAGDLAANRQPCTLAYFHHPRYTSGQQLDTPSLQPLWADLYAARADLVLVGHDHDYERFDRLGKVPTFTGGVEQPIIDPNGMREIVVGTGGRNHTSFTGGFKTGSQVQDTSSFGVIKVTLHAGSYEWQFLPSSGGTFTDAGSSSCRVASNTPLDATAPNVPSGLSASSPSQTQIDLSWSATSDNVGVGGYDVLRDGALVGTTDGTTTSFSDTGLLAGSTHTYTVDAFDAAGNKSAQSSPVPGTTQGAAGTTFTPVADAYVSSAAPAINYGLATTLRVDGASPIQKSYLKFTLSGLSGTVTNATLRVYANGSQGTGYDVFGVPDSSWIESGTGGITYNTAPPPAGSKTGSSGPVSGGTWTSVPVTALVSGNGTYSFALSTTSPTGLSLSSRQGANTPQLVVSTSSGNRAPTAGPVSVNATSAVSTPWTPVVSDPNGDPLTCTLVTLPSHGTATLTSCSGGTYTSTGGYTGPDSFTYRANDGSLNSPTATVTATVSSGGGGTFTFTATADAYVDSSQASLNFGISNTIRVDASPTLRSYLTFNITGLTGTVSSVSLRVFANSSQSVGYSVFSVADTSWGETAINFSNAPALGSATGSSGPTTAGTWTTVNVTPLVTGNGTISIALTTTSPTNLNLASRETGANAPQLVITTT